MPLSHPSELNPVWVSVLCNFILQIRLGSKVSNLAFQELHLFSIISLKNEKTATSTNCWILLREHVSHNDNSNIDLPICQPGSTLHTFYKLTAKRHGRPLNTNICERAPASKYEVLN